MRISTALLHSFHFGLPRMSGDGPRYLHARACHDALGECIPEGAALPIPEGKRYIDYLRAFHLVDAVVRQDARCVYPCDCGAAAVKLVDHDVAKYHGADDYDDRWEAAARTVRDELYWLDDEDLLEAIRTAAETGGDDNV